MRISDWSSDVCSSDLRRPFGRAGARLWAGKRAVRPLWRGLARPHPRLLLLARQPAAQGRAQIGLIGRIDFRVLRFRGVDPPVEIIREAGEALPKPRAVVSRWIALGVERAADPPDGDRKSTRLNSSP